jgi:hypothetical protein
MNYAGPAVRSVIICDDVRREDNGKEILIGVYNDKIVIDRQPPFLLPTLCVRFVMKIDSGEHKIDLSITGPDRNEIVKLTTNINVPTAEYLTAVSFRLTPFAITSLGNYHINLELGESQIGAHSFEVITKEQMEEVIKPARK